MRKWTMGRKIAILSSHFLLFFCVSTLFPVNGDPSCEQVEQDLKKITTKFKTYRKKTLMAFKQMVAEEHVCPPCTRWEEKEVKDLRAKVNRLERRSHATVAGKLAIKQSSGTKNACESLNFCINDVNFYWICAALTALPIKTSKAIVDRPGILAKANDTVDLLCKAPPGEYGLNLCWWWKNDGSRSGEVMIVDREVVRKGEGTWMEGITLVGNELEEGKCGVKIGKLKAEYFGHWSCHLLTHAGRIFQGELSIIDGK